MVCGSHSLTHRLSPLLGHRPLTRVLQALRFWAVFSSCFQVPPIALMSSCRSRRHEFLGRPLLLFPCGFQDRACLVMLSAGFLNVWPIHLHLLWRISVPAGFWSVCCHSSSFLIRSGQWILNMRLRHQLMNLWILLVMALVVRHVSAP